MHVLADPNTKIIASTPTILKKIVGLSEVLFAEVENEYGRRRYFLLFWPETHTASFVVGNIGNISTTGGNICSYLSLVPNSTLRNMNLILPYNGCEYPFSETFYKCLSRFLIAKN